MSASRRKLEAAFWFAVVRAYQECTRRYNQLMKGFGLTIPQFDVMNAIQRLGDKATPKAIANELVVTRGNVTGVLYRLETSELIETHGNERDGRSFICELTEDGRELLDRARSAASNFIRQQLAPFDDAQLRTTESQMKEMHAHLQTIDPDAIAARVSAAR